MQVRGITSKYGRASVNLISGRGIKVDVTIGADGYGGFILKTWQATDVLLL